jgi:hypothetical protein
MSETYTVRMAVSVRTGAGTAYRWLRNLSRGTQVEVIGSKGLWKQISDGNWVHGAYLVVDSTAPRPPRREASSSQLSNVIQQSRTNVLNDLRRRLRNSEIRFSRSASNAVHSGSSLWNHDDVCDCAFSPDSLFVRAGGNLPPDSPMESGIDRYHRSLDDNFDRDQRHRYEAEAGAAQAEVRSTRRALQLLDDR